jgi:hypothetical protein
MKQPEYDDGSAGPVFVRYVFSLPCHSTELTDRLAWHASGNYSLVEVRDSR